MTRTGRGEGTPPNMQNIPIRTEEGRLIREAFVNDRPCCWREKVKEYNKGITE